MPDRMFHRMFYPGSIECSIGMLHRMFYPGAGGDDGELPGRSASGVQITSLISSVEAERVLFQGARGYFWYFLAEWGILGAQIVGFFL